VGVDQASTGSQRSKYVFNLSFGKMTDAVYCYIVTLHSLVCACACCLFSLFIFDRYAKYKYKYTNTDKIQTSIIIISS